MRIESVEEPDSFSAKDYFSDADGTLNQEMPAQRFIMELIEEGDKTRLVTRSIVESADQLEDLINMGMVEGFTSQLRKLESMLAE